MFPFLLLSFFLKRKDNGNLIDKDTIMKATSTNNRRDFLKKCGIAAVPLLIPTIAYGSSTSKEVLSTLESQELPVNFIFDGKGYPLYPNAYLNKLSEINKNTPIEYDFYSQGGDVTKLEKKFAEITGKEAAIYLPTGTMANQIAIKLLSEDNTKVIVPENSHIYRDEADAAQSVHNKRLIPVGKGKHHYELSDLKKEISYLNAEEVFRSGLGTVVIENPVRRANGRFVPLQTIKEVTAYCKKNNYKTHLDGARIHIASAYSGVSVEEYASHFDTVYISLYKYLNTSGGAVLCGDKELIDKISHQIKIYGGTVFQNWHIASMALHHINGVENRWQQVKAKADILMKELNKLKGVQFEQLERGTNIYHLKLGSEAKAKKFAYMLSTQHKMLLRGSDKNGMIELSFNESLLQKDIAEIVKIWKAGIKNSSK